MRRLNSKKVFVVLDDVDCFEQLEYLCGERSNIGPNSRLIITTRDRHLLTGRVDEIHEVKRWNFGESLQLFCLNAFMKSHPLEGFKDLSDRAVHYAGGVPLALKVLGSHLYSRSHEFWESTLSKLEKCPNEKILNVLKVSYDGLDSLEKNIFLDIAFFFKNKDKDDLVRMLDASGLCGASGIDILVDKALITISCSNSVQMHDLLQEMGLEIVRKEYSENPGRCSRLKGHEAYDVLNNNKGTDAVEGIALDLSQIVYLHLSTDIFNRMPNLRFLQLYVSLGKRSSTMYHPTVLKAFSDKLRFLEWNGYPFKSLPATFCAKFLVEIRMPHSPVKELWQGMQDLGNLEEIDLHGCEQLIKLSDLSMASRLKRVNLSGCASLCDLHPSLLSVDTLNTLILDMCIKLKSLKSEKHLKYLHTLSVKGCSSLREFSVSSDSIAMLDLSKTGTEILHSSIGCLSRLMWLNLEGLRLKNLPDELSKLTSLADLRISYCKQVINKEKLHLLFDCLRNLIILYLKDCCSLSDLPDNISLLSSLYDLRLDGSSVERLPTSIKHLQELEILSLKNCRKLQCLPELPPSIKKLYADNCTSLVAVSTLKSFAAQKKGEYQDESQRISFRNCMKLDGHSLNCIIEDTLLTMKSAVFHDALERRYGVSTHSHTYEYNRVRVCLPGSKVPRQFTCRTIKSSINIELPSHSNLLGFIYFVVLSPSPIMKKEEIYCKCYLADGTRVSVTWCNYEFTMDLNSDHVFVWYDPFDCEQIRRTFERLVSFKFGVKRKQNGSIVMKECGIRPICVSEFHSFLGELELELDKKVELGVKLGLALDSESLCWQGDMDERYLGKLQHGCQLNASMKFEYASGRRAILKAIEKKAQKSKGFVLDSHSLVGEFHKKVELGLKLGLALDMQQLWLELEYALKLGESYSLCRAFRMAISKVAQKSNEFVSESHSFLGEIELEFDKKLELGVIVGLEMHMKQNRLKRAMHQRLLDALEHGWELKASFKSEYESRRRAMLTALEKETQKSNEFVFPSLPTGIWKNTTQGLKDIVSLFL